MSNPLSVVKGMTIRESVDAIALMGAEVSFLLLGEPGIGKSAVHKILAKRPEFQNHIPVYFDCTNREPADTTMYVPSGNMLKQMVSEIFHPDKNQPLLVMLDEFGKGSQMLKQACAALLNERRIGDHILPEGSVIFATTNNSTDGVGDNIHAHQLSRVSKYRMLKPTVAELCTHFADIGVDALLRTCIQLNPSMLDSYEDLDQESRNRNPYIFVPDRKAAQFVCPRTLEKAHHIVKNRNRLSDNVLFTLLAGTCGAAFAQTFTTFQDFEKYVHAPEAIVANPSKLDVPESDGALWHMMNKGIDFVRTQDQMTAYMTYVKRFPRVEHHGIFFSMITSSNKTAALAKNNPEVTKWRIANYELMM